MDKATKKYLLLVKWQPRHYIIPGEPWSLWKQGSKLATNLDNAIYTIVHAKYAGDYWKKKGGLQDNSLEHINWEAMAKAAKEVPRSRWYFIMKHSSCMCGVGKFMKRWKQRLLADCSHCGQLEDVQNLCVWQGQDSSTVWEALLKLIQDWMASVDMDLNLQCLLLSYSKSWWYNSPASLFTPPYLQTLLDEQSSIGWNRYLEGWVGTQWVIAQQHHYNILKSRRTGCH